MKVESDESTNVDPFESLAHGLPLGKLSVGSQTLAVIGATFADGTSGFWFVPVRETTDRPLRAPHPLRANVGSDEPQGRVCHRPQL